MRGDAGVVLIGVVGTVGIRVVVVVVAIVILLHLALFFGGYVDTPRYAVVPPDLRCEFHEFNALEGFGEELFLLFDEPRVGFAGVFSAHGGIDEDGCGDDVNEGIEVFGE